MNEAHALVVRFTAAGREAFDHTVARPVRVNSMILIAVGLWMVPALIVLAVYSTRAFGLTAPTMSIMVSVVIPLAAASLGVRRLRRPPRFVPVAFTISPELVVFPERSRQGLVRMVVEGAEWERAATLARTLPAKGVRPASIEFRVSGSRGRRHARVFVTSLLDTPADAIIAALKRGTAVC